LDRLAERAERYLGDSAVDHRDFNVFPTMRISGSRCAVNRALRWCGRKPVRAIGACNGLVLTYEIRGLHPTGVFPSGITMARGVVTRIAACESITAAVAYRVGSADAARS